MDEDPLLGFQVYGLQETLKILKATDKELEKEVKREIRAIAAPLLAKGRDSYPEESPLTPNAKGGWRPGGRLGYDPAKVRQGVTVQFGGRRPRNARQREVWPGITLIQKNAGGALFDIAGLRGGSQGKGGKRGEKFISKLYIGFGPAQRGLWRATHKELPLIRGAVLDAVKRASVRINQNLTVKE